MSRMSGRNPEVLVEKTERPCEVEPVGNYLPLLEPSIPAPTPDLRVPAIAAAAAQSAVNTRPRAPRARLRAFLLRAAGSTCR